MKRDATNREVPPEMRTAEGFQKESSRVSPYSERQSSLSGPGTEKPAAGAVSYRYEYSSPLGILTLTSDGSCLTGLWFEGQRYFGSTLRPESLPQILPLFARTAEWLDCYFGGGQPDFLPALRMEGSLFRQTVWKVLLQIPYGETVSYRELAAEVARQRDRSFESPRAVGGAVGHNPISIIVPCHRVIGSGGSLTGYAGGIPRKIALLTLEGVDLSRFRSPAQSTLF